MKNTLILTIFALTLSAMACSPKVAKKMGIGMEVVNKAFNQMIADTNEGDITKIMDHTYPKMFDMMPRAQMEAVYTQQKSMMEGSGVTNKIVNASLKDVSEFVTSGTQQFAKGKMVATNQMLVKDKTIIPMLEQQVKMMVGAESIKTTDEGIEMAVNDDVYIIHDNETKKMYFLQANAQVKPMLGQLLPEDVLEKLK